ncbi:MAG: hypothetical protein LW834_07015 [Cyanobium sp. 49614_E6]|jgi:hypothetical protein|nr:hypothetical protein [Cyanobium sp. 49614_E6]
MALNFPDSPVDGASYTDVTSGKTWVYEAATTSWTQTGAGGGGAGGVAGALSYRGGINVTIPPPAGAMAGWLYKVTTAGAVNAGFTGLSGSLPLGASVLYDGAAWQELIQGGGLWVRQGSSLKAATAGDLLDPAVLPAATTASSGGVRLADSADIANGTAGRAIDAAALQLARVWGRVGSTLAPMTPGDVVVPSALPAATSATQGAVQLADATAIGAGTAGRVVDAAQLKADRLWSRTAGVLTPSTGGDVLDPAALPAATAAAAGVVRLADAAALLAGTASRAVDAAQLKAAGIHVGATAPADLRDGRLWWDTGLGQLSIYGATGGGALQWTVVGPSAGGIKAWVNFNGAAVPAWAGGAATVARVAGSTTATVTSAAPHGLVTGHSVYALSGVVAGTYVVTVISPTQFRFTTTATTALNNVAIMFATNAIRASKNVSSVADIALGVFIVNFTVPFADGNYAIVGAGGSSKGTSGTISPSRTAPTVASCTLETALRGATADLDFSNVAFIA